MRIKKSLGYKFEPKKYLFGICEEFEGSLDDAANADTTIDLVSQIGARSMRIWMHHKRLMQVVDGKPVWRQDVFLRYRGYVQKLTEKGIRILAMNHNYLFPSSFDGDKNSVSEMSERGSRAYIEQMQLLADAYEMMAREFPEIEYWECGNEPNMNFYLAKPGYSGSGVKNSEYDPKYCYNNLEKARMVADICYYSNLGLKRGNKAAKTVFPAPTPYRGYAEMAEFYEFVYQAIESGEFPTGRAPDTNPDNYFQVQCYHAYNFGGDACVLTDGAQMIHRIMNVHGDGGKKVFISEFGYHDSDFVDNRGMTREQADKAQAAFFETDFKAFESLGFVETVYVFRLYDWIAGPGIEVDFGLFTSPSSPQGITIKEKGKALCRLFGGTLRQ